MTRETVNIDTFKWVIRHNKHKIFEIRLAQWKESLNKQVLSQLFIYAILHHRLLIANILIKFGASVHGDKSTRLPSPLVIAANQGDVRMCLLLFNLGAGQELREPYVSPLTEALLNFSDGRAARLLSFFKSTEPCDEHPQVSCPPGHVKCLFDCRQALHLAILRRNLPCVKSLVQAGCRKILLDEIEGNTPLHLACSQSDRELEIVKSILQMDTNNSRYKSNDMCFQEILINTKNRKGQTPLDLAVEWGNVKIANFLLDLKICKNVLHSALKVAVSKHDIDLVKRIVENETIGKIHDSLLHDSVEFEDVYMAEILLNAGVDPMVKSSAGNSLLNVAMKSQNTDIVEFVESLDIETTSLQSLCRSAVRSAIITHCKSKTMDRHISTLPLPVTLQNYLLYKVNLKT